MNDLEQIKAIRAALPHNARKLTQPHKSYMWKRLVTGQLIPPKKKEVTA